VSGGQHGGDDAFVAGASAQVAGHPLPDLGSARSRSLRKQRGRRDHLTWGADPALEPAMSDEGTLDRRQRAIVRGNAFDGDRQYSRPTIDPGAQFDLKRKRCHHHMLAYTAVHNNIQRALQRVGARRATALMR